MKDKELPMPDYASPMVEFMEVEIEQGFAASTTVRGWEDGGNLGDCDVEQ